MAYANRWSITFKDLDENTRTIYIQQDGWTGGVTALIPGANPMTWDEDSSEDMNSRVRGITGRLEVIEEEYGDLTEMFPATPLQYRVVCQNVFYGYIKVQNSTNAWDSGPRALSFNILSPLALAYDIPMPINTTMGMREVGEVINELMATLGYSSISMPKGECELGDFFRGQIRGMHICPFADDKDYHYANEDEIFAPISCGQLIEEICMRHDLMAHDAIEGQSASLVLSRRLDTNGMYMWLKGNIAAGTYDMATLLIGPNHQSHTLLNEFSVAGNNNSESLVKPYSYIDILHDGEAGGNDMMPTTHSEYKASVSQFYLTPRGIWLTNKNGYIKLGLHGAYIDDAFQYVDTLFYDIYPSTIPTGTLLMSLTFYHVDKGAEYRLKIRYSHNSDGGHDSLNISARGKGGWYVGGNGGPHDNPEWPTESFSHMGLAGDSGHGTEPQTEYEAEFPLYMLADEYITVNIYVAQNGDPLSNLYIREVELVKRPELETSLTSVRWGEERFVRRIMGSVGTKPLKVNYAINDTFFSNYYVTDYDFYNNNMTYLLRSQRRLQIYVKGATLDKLWYLYRYIIMGEDGWSVIAISYDVRNNIYKLTLHNTI